MKSDYQANSITLTGGVSMGTGVMIGAGIFALTGQIAELAGPWFPLSFIAGGIVTGFSAYTYVKMSNAFPSAGGIAMILQKAYGPGAIAAAAALLMALSMVINESLVARTFGAYVLRPFELEAGSILVPALGVGLIVFAYLVNISGNRSVGLFSVVMAFLKIGGIAAFGIAALALAGIPPLAGFFSKDAILAAALAAPGVVWLAPLALAGTVLTGAYMARALRVLWQGEAQPVLGKGMGWMGAGMAVLTALAAGLGFAFTPLEHLLEAELPPEGTAMILGLMAALSGLVLGWFIQPARLMGPVLPMAQRGFAVAGGMDGLVLRPSLAFAAACEGFERRLLASQLGLVRILSLGTASSAERSDKRLYAATLQVGRMNLRLGDGAENTDTHGIDGLIFGLVARTIAAGRRLRLLQSGLIHRELALTVMGIAVIAAVLLILPMSS